MEKKMYMVLRMQTEIEVWDSSGKFIEQKLKGCAGYAPIFKTHKQAVKNSNNKYEIVLLTVK